MKHKVLKKQHSSKMCFVCGENNDFGLRAKFYETDNNELVALINPSEQHQGYPGRMHGGIAATILDETMARSICNGKDEQLWGVTLELKTKFRKPVPLGQELKVVGRVTSEGSRSFEGTGEIVLPNGDIAVSAEGKYIKLSIDKIANDQFINEEWFFAGSPDDPSEIEIPWNIQLVCYSFGFREILNGYRFIGNPTLHDSGDLYEQAVAMSAKMGLPEPLAVVVIHVSEIHSLKPGPMAGKKIS